MTGAGLWRAIIEGLISSPLVLVLSVALSQQTYYLILGEFVTLVFGQVMLALLSKSDEIANALAVFVLLCAIAVFVGLQSFNVKFIWFGVLGGNFAFQLSMVETPPVHPLGVVAFLLGAVTLLLLGLAQGVFTFYLLSFFQFTPSSLWLSPIGGAITGFILSFLPSVVFRGLRETANLASRKGFATLIPGCIAGSVFGLWSGINALQLNTLSVVATPYATELPSLETDVWLVLISIVIGTKTFELVQHILARTQLISEIWSAKYIESVRRFL